MSLHRLRRCRSLEGEICFAQSIDIVDMVPERRELQSLIPAGCLPYPIQRAVQAFGVGRAFP